MASNYLEIPPANSSGVSTVTATAPVASTGGANPVISMQAADATHNGYLTSTDFNTFNNKQSTAFTPSDPTKWDGNPTTIQEAINRIAAVVGSGTPIP